MTWRIIFKEILENLLSLRFALSLVLVICLFAASGHCFVFDITTKNVKVITVVQQILAHILLRY